ncbi:MAG TPA: phosphatase PAP2 family protein [Actinomycetota bacterium]|jgi:undecaprenyl-diphosphatase|nr:phosphatase PAP2 family protein [Actinomycetota bacterium]
MAWLPRPGYSRNPADAVRVVLGGAVLAVTTTAIHKDFVGDREAALFRVVNELALPSWTWPGVWLVMQLGVIGAVPLVAILALATRRLRLALDAVLAAGSIYLIAKLVKEFVQRGRPQTLLDGVNILGEPARGLGYVSGHSAVAVALATVASPYLGRRARRVAWILAGCVCLARMYVGSHLPFDVVGGAALGWAAGSLVLFVLGAPDPRPSLARLRSALGEHGLEVTGLEPVGDDVRRSTCYVTGGGEGPELFVKVVVAEWRERDLLWRAWRRLARRGRTRPLRVGSPHHEVEHEASMALLAARAGVRAPEVLLVRSFNSGAGMLVQQRVVGRDLAHSNADEVDDALLTELWRQVGLLHRAGIAHGDLVPANCMVDGDGRPWLVDYDQAQAASGTALLERDRAELLAALSALVGPERAKRTSETTLV